MYRASGITKQNFHQRYNRILAREDELAQLELLMHQIRTDHPGLGGVLMYHKLQPEFIGRDRFLEYYRSLNLQLRPTKNYRKTTNSSGVVRFPNMVEGLELRSTNQVWVSDITYIEVAGRFYYLTLIMDQYSRKIIGYSASKTLRTANTTIPALRMALKQLPAGCKPIFHSDGGGQYYSKDFLSITAGVLINSMAETVYENPYAERINGTIKNDYLLPWRPQTFSRLQSLLTKAVNNYNCYRPHRALNKRTPEQVHRTTKPQNQQVQKTVNSI